MTRNNRWIVGLLAVLAAPLTMMALHHTNLSEQRQMDMKLGAMIGMVVVLIVEFAVKRLTKRMP